jgi:integrase
LELLVLTGQRQGEVTGLRWSELNLDKAMWTLPASRAKNHREHQVPLSPAALAILRDVPKRHGIDLLFTTNGETAPS